MVVVSRLACVSATEREPRTAVVRARACAPSLAKHPIGVGASMSGSHGRRRSLKDDTVMRESVPKEYTYQLTRNLSFHWAGYDLRGGLSNRLFLSLRSGIPSEVDWALHHLLAVSHERDTEFELVKWPGSVEGLLEVVEDWVLDVTLRAKESDGEAAHVLSSHDELDRERRATDAILVLRNAAHLKDENKVVIAGVLARPSAYANSRTAQQVKTMTSTTTRKYLPSRFLLTFNEIFGTLPMDQLIRLSLRAPEPLIYLLDLFVLCMPQSCPGHPFRILKQNTRPVHPHTVDILQRLMLDILPKLYINSSDLAIIVVIMQIYLHSPKPFTPSMNVLAPKLLPNLLLTPTSINGMPSPYPRNLALFSLDLLYALTINEAAALTLLKLPDVDAWIRVILGLTGWNTKREPHSWRQPERMAGRKVPLPQVNGRSVPPVQNGSNNNAGCAVPDDDGSANYAEPFGLGPVLKMSAQKRERLRRLPEPKRCREW
jgi:chromatin structure-remodeling complex subunit RSC9